MILLAHSYFLRHDPKQLARMKPYPPLATLLTASLLRERGYEIAFFDAMLSAGVEEFVAMLDATRPTIVGILEDNFNFLTKMCTVVSRDATLSMIRAARDRGCRVAVNGSDSTDRPGLYLDAGADAVVLGEGDLGFLALADAWRSEPAVVPSGVAGLALPDGVGGITYTTPRAGLRDLDLLPVPAWDLIDVENYRAAWRGAHGRFSWNMVSSRGCPYGCNWCAKPVFGRRYAQRAAVAVAEEMRQLKHRVAPDHLWFADDIFGLTPEWIGTFARAVTLRDARIPFMMQSRVDLMRPAVVAALAEAGAEEVWLGVESGSQRILDAMEKGTKVEDVRAATRELKAHGIRACWFVQIGYPTETWDDILRTRDLIRQEEPDDIGVSVTYPLPGTAFHESVRAQLGDQRNWAHTDDLAMLFRGTYNTAFYRAVRDALHEDARGHGTDDARWAALAREERSQRSEQPTNLVIERSA
jgi:anaerobic magnesium-protoporphyrin IX monomethyl ester cyclase